MFVCKILLVVALASITRALDSPCPELFRYDAGSRQGQWTGTVTLQSDYELHGVWVRLIFDGKLTELSSDDFGEVVPSDNGREFLIKDSRFLLKEETPTNVRITVKYEGSKVPQLISYRLNAKVVCPERNSRPEDYYLGDFNNKNFLASILSNAASTEYEEPASCGTVPLNSESSPWQATLSLKSKNKEEYLCGATLISPRHLLTAAHCVTYRNSEFSIPSQSLVAYLGKTKLNENGPATQQLGVRRVTVYPGYRAQTLLNDLALVELDQAAIISDYVRPICLGETKSEEGVVAGYGFTKAGQAKQLEYADVKLVAHEECQNLNPALKPLLGDNTLCGRYSRDDAVCVGNSGNGLASRRQSPQPVWDLTGIVTVGPSLQGKYDCKKSGAVLLQDVGRYRKWIQGLVR